MLRQDDALQDNAPRHRDGSAGDAYYGAIGKGYVNFRRPDPRIAELRADGTRATGTIGSDRLSSAFSS